MSIPERRYNLAGELLLKAIQAEQPHETAHSAALRVARERGHALGKTIRRERRLRRLGAQRVYPSPATFSNSRDSSPTAKTGASSRYATARSMRSLSRPPSMCHIN